MNSTLAKRWWTKILVTDTCWLWTASLDGKGYGQINAGGNGGKPRRAHRVGYELLVGPIPEGMQLDHLCRNRRCVNPGHLEPVTNRQNSLRGERATRAAPCPHGHLARRDCAECRRDQRRRQWEQLTPEQRAARVEYTRQWRAAHPEFWERNRQYLRARRLEQGKAS